MFRLRDRFQPYAAIQSSYGAAFRALGGIGADEAEAAGSLPWTQDEIESAFEYASIFADTARLPRLVAAELVALVVAGHAAAFEEAFAAPQLAGMSADPEVAAALNWCRSRVEAFT